MKHIVLVLCLVSLCGCASPAYRQVLKEEPRYNMREFAASKGIMSQAITRAFLSKNFMIESDEAGKGFLLARRSFQKGRKTDVVLIQAKIMAMNDAQCTVYLNGVETSEVCYVTDRTRFLLFLIPLPGGGGKQAASVKQGEKIINDKRFYETFFSAIDEELAYVKAAQPPNEVSAAFEKLAQDVQMPDEAHEQ